MSTEHDRYANAAPGPELEEWEAHCGNGLPAHSQHELAIDAMTSGTAGELPNAATADSDVQVADTQGYWFMQNAMGWPYIDVPTKVPSQLQARFWTHLQHAIVSGQQYTASNRLELYSQFPELRDLIDASYRIMCKRWTTAKPGTQNALAGKNSLQSGAKLAVNHHQNASTSAQVALRSQSAVIDLTGNGLPHVDNEYLAATQHQFHEILRNVYRPETDTKRSTNFKKAAHPEQCVQHAADRAPARPHPQQRAIPTATALSTANEAIKQDRSAQQSAKRRKTDDERLHCLKCRDKVIVNKPNLNSGILCTYCTNRVKKMHGDPEIEALRVYNAAPPVLQAQFANALSRMIKSRAAALESQQRLPKSPQPALGVSNDDLAAHGGQRAPGCSSGPPSTGMPLTATSSAVSAPALSTEISEHANSDPRSAYGAVSNPALAMPYRLLGGKRKFIGAESSGSAESFPSAGHLGDHFFRAPEAIMLPTIPATEEHVDGVDS